MVGVDASSAGMTETGGLATAVVVGADVPSSVPVQAAAIDARPTTAARARRRAPGRGAVARWDRRAARWGMEVLVVPVEGRPGPTRVPPRGARVASPPRAAATLDAPMTARPPAIVLLSGGLDSATCLAIAADEGFAPVAVSFRYGQRHHVELDAAAGLAASAGAEHLVIDVDLAAIGGSALTDDGPVPHPADVEDIADQGIPPTYVPARNTVFLSLALAVAEVRSADDLFLGVNALDYSGYPDCRPAFVAAFEDLANLATARAVADGHRLRVHAPLLEMTKAEIITRAVELGVDLGATRSCYDPTAEGLACGRCDSCLLRRRGFTEAGVADPTAYRSRDLGDDEGST